jgi:hypothetical protein
MRDMLNRWIARWAGKVPLRRIAIFGDSHTVALSSALAFRSDSLKPALPNIELYRLRKLKGETVLGDTDLDEFCSKISNFNGEDFVFSAIGGNQYAVVSTVRAPPYFDLALPKGVPSQSESSASIIPYRVLESYIANGVVNSDGPMLKRIRSATRARVFHLTPPPPKQDNAFLKQFHEARFAAEGMGDLEPHAPELRLACWNIQRKVLATLCGEIGIELLPPPPVAVGAEGFLERHYYSKDVTHANRRYGEQVLRQIAEVAMLDGNAE